MTDAGSDRFEVVRAIARSPALLDEAKAVAGALAERAQPIAEEVLLGKLISLAPLFGISNRSPDEWATFYGHYLDALNVYPEEAIDEAIVEWNRGPSNPVALALNVHPAPFLPKPIDLSRLAGPAAARIRMAAYRAKSAAAFRDANPREKTPEERARDRQAAIDAGLFDENGKVILNFKTDESRRVGGPGETRQEMADRLRRIDEEIRQATPPPAGDEETV